MNEGEKSKMKPLAAVYELIDAEKFKQAFPFVLDIKSAADNGDAVAQYYLGLLLISNKEDAEGGRYLRLSVYSLHLKSSKPTWFTGMYRTRKFKRTPYISANIPRSAARVTNSHPAVL